MTSASSSSPKKGLSFFSYHRNLFGRRLWVGVVSIVLQLLFYTVATPLRIVYDRSQVADQLTTEIARATYRTKQAQMIFGQMCLSSIAMGLTLLLAVVIAHQGFAYVFSRRELDFYMSQPVKRSRHFRDVYINGIMLFALPYMISVLLGVCVAEGMHSMSTLVFGEILYGMLRMFFFFVGIIRELFRKNTEIVKNAFKEIDYYTIILLTGLFVVIGGIKNAGVIDIIGNAISKVGGSSGSVFIVYTVIVWMSVILSAFIDNIPFAATMLPVIRAVSMSLGIEPYLLYFGLLTGATLGGNLTPVGASANIAATGILKKEGYEVSFQSFMKIGVPFTLTAVTVGYLFLWLVWK